MYARLEVEQARLEVVDGSDIEDLDDLPPVPDESQDMKKRTVMTDDENISISEQVQNLVTNQPDRWLVPPNKYCAEPSYRIVLGMNPKTGKSYPHMKSKDLQRLWRHLRTVLMKVKKCPNITTVEVRMNAETRVHKRKNRSEAHRSVVVAGGQYNGGELICENWQGQPVKIDIFKQAYVCTRDLKWGSAPFTGQRWEAEGFVPIEYAYTDHSTCKYRISREVNETEIDRGPARRVSPVDSEQSAPVASRP